jgi:transposase
MSPPRTKQYLAAFKVRAVRLAVESEQPSAQTARDRGVHDTTVPTWLGQSHRVERPEKQGKAAPVSEARTRLRKETARFKEARAI